MLITGQYNKPDNFWPHEKFIHKINTIYRMGPWSYLLHASLYIIQYEIINIIQSDNTNYRDTNIHSELFKTRGLLHQGSSNIPQSIFAHPHF